MRPDAPNLSYDLLTASLLKDIVTLEMTQQEQPLGEANSLYDSWATVSKKQRLRKNTCATLQSIHPSFISGNILTRGVSGSFNAEFLIKTCHIVFQPPPVRELVQPTASFDRCSAGTGAQHVEDWGRRAAFHTNFLILLVGS